MINRLGVSAGNGEIVVYGRISISRAALRSGRAEEVARHEAEALTEELFKMILYEAAKEERPS